MKAPARPEGIPSGLAGCLGRQSRHALQERTVAEAAGLADAVVATIVPSSSAPRGRGPAASTGWTSSYGCRSVGFRCRLRTIEPFTALARDRLLALRDF